MKKLLLAVFVCFSVSAFSATTKTVHQEPDQEIVKASILACVQALVEEYPQYSPGSVQFLQLLAICSYTLGYNQGFEDSDKMPRI